jgi:hypothetical protein
MTLAALEARHIVSATGGTEHRDQLVARLSRLAALWRDRPADDLANAPPAVHLALSLDLDRGRQEREG